MNIHRRRGKITVFHVKIATIQDTQQTISTMLQGESTDDGGKW